eukprot:evm.model.scf_2001.2 EVM.evm.TU.scf_2001.2   scf_2001:13214-17301(-)
MSGSGGRGWGGQLWEVAGAASALQSCGDPWGTGFRALRLCMEKCGSPFGALMLVAGDGGTFAVVAAEGRGAEAMPLLGTHRLKNSGWSLEAVAMTGSTKLTGDIGRGWLRPTDWVLLHKTAGYRSFMSVPVGVQGVCRGCVTLAATGCNAFVEADAEAVAMVLSLYAFHVLDGQLGRACGALHNMSQAEDLREAVRLWLAFLIKEFGLRSVGLSLLVREPRVAVFVTLSESADGRSAEYEYGGASVTVDKKTLLWRTELVAAPIHIRDCQEAPPRERDVAMLKVERGEVGCLLVVPLTEDHLSQVKPAGGVASGAVAGAGDPPPSPPPAVAGQGARYSSRGEMALGISDGGGRVGDRTPKPEAGCAAPEGGSAGASQPGKSSRRASQNAQFGNGDVDGRGNDAGGSGADSGSKSGATSVSKRRGAFGRPGPSRPAGSSDALTSHEFDSDQTTPSIDSSSAFVNTKLPQLDGMSPFLPAKLPPLSLVRKMGAPGPARHRTPHSDSDGTNTPETGSDAGRSMHAPSPQSFPSPFVSPRSTCSPSASDDTVVLSSGDVSTGDNPPWLPGPGPPWRPGFHSALTFPPPVHGHDDRNENPPVGPSGQLRRAGSGGRGPKGFPASPVASPCRGGRAIPPPASPGEFRRPARGGGGGRFRNGITAGPSMPQRGVVPGPGPRPPTRDSSLGRRRGGARTGGPITPPSPQGSLNFVGLGPQRPPVIGLGGGEGGHGNTLGLGAKADRLYGAVYLIGLKPGAFDEATRRAKAEGLAGMFAHKFYSLVTSRMKPAFEELLARAAKQRDDGVRPDDPLREKIDSVILKLGRNRREMTVGRQNRLRLLSVLGKGTNGLVLQGRWQNVLTAVKIVKHSSALLQGQEGENPILKMATEMALATYVSHPNIVRNYESFPSMDYQELLKTCIVHNPAPHPDSPTPNTNTEITPRTDDPTSYGYLDYATSWIVKRLHRAVWGSPTPAADKTPLSGRALKRLPSAGSRVSTPHSTQVHEDSWLTKHLQKRWPLQDLHASQWALLVMEYCDRETLEEVSPGVDVYSFGIILWEMYYSKRPYSTLHSGDSVCRRVVREGLRPTFGDSAPLRFRNLAERCWNENVAKRPTFGVIVDELTALRAP